ncbi:DUF2599 domain-containing protein [Peribacillus sp. NPDC101481]
MKNRVTGSILGRQHRNKYLPLYKSSWNLEPWRPDKTKAGIYINTCNPT